MAKPTRARSQTAFLTIFVAGMATVILVAVFRLHDGFTIVGPVLAMAIYFWWVRDRPGDQADVEQYADSFYYLGFLFTLAALLVAILPNVWLQSMSMESLFGRLGLALVTTILGLGGRIVMTQFRTSPDQDVQQATSQLAGAVAGVAVELETSLTKLVEMREKTVEKIESAATAAAHQIDLAARQQDERITEANTRILERTTEAISIFEEKVNRIDVPSTILVDAFKQRTDDINRGLGELAEVVQFAVDLGKEQTALWDLTSKALVQHRQDLEAAGKSAQLIVNEVRAGVETIDTVVQREDERVTEVYRSLLERTTDVVAAFVEKVKLIEIPSTIISDAIKLRTAAIGVELGELAAVVHGAVDLGKEQTAAWDALSRATAQHRQDLEDAGKAALSIVKEVRSEVEVMDKAKATMAGLEPAATRFARAVDQHAVSTRSVGQALDEEAIRIRGLRDEVDAFVSRLGSATEALVEGMNVFSERIEGKNQ